MLFKVRISSDGGNPIFPITGQISIGNVGRPESPFPGEAILHSGTVKPIGYSLFSHSRYEADSTALEPGDQFEIDPDGQPESSGLVAADDGLSMQVTYRGTGKVGHVSRFGATGFDIDIPMVQRIKHDEVVQGIWGVFIFLMGIKVLRRNEGETN